MSDEMTGSEAVDVRNSRRLAIVLALVVGYAVVEVVAAYATGSLSLLSDAGHMGTDALGLAMSLAAILTATRMERRKRQTFGLYRLEILAALANALLLVGIAGYTLYEGITRLGNPPQIEGGLMLWVAVGGMMVNVAGIALLRGLTAESLNLQGAYTEVFADLLGASSQSPQAAQAVEQMAASREDWWPDLGTFFASDSSVTFTFPPPCTVLCPPVNLVLPTRELVHELEWEDQEAIDLLTSGFAYEHDLKLFNDSLDPGTVSPFCGFASDDFWSSRTVLWWDSTIPFFAGPYLDTDALDPCTQKDLTIGILLPSAMAAGFYSTEIETLQGVNLPG